MTAAIGLLLLLQPVDVAELIAAGRYQEAAARSPDALFAAISDSKDETHIKGVVLEIQYLRGSFQDRPERAAAWLLRLSEALGGDVDALVGAGYCYLVARKGKDAVAPLEKAAEMGATGRGLCLLADAYRAAGREPDAVAALKRAAEDGNAPQKYLQDLALSLATRLRTARDRSYADLLDKVGLTLRAALWLAEDVSYARGDTKELKKSALGLFQRALDDAAPATAWWEAAKLAEGDVRYKYLVEAVRRGESAFREQDHAVPDAVLALARACKERGRPVAAAALAKKRLRIGECPPAWELLESLPAEYAR